MKLSVCKSHFTSSFSYVELDAKGITIFGEFLKYCLWSNTFNYWWVVKASGILQNADKFRFCFTPLKKKWISCECWEEIASFLDLPLYKRSMLRSMLFGVPGYLVFNIYLDKDWNIVWCFNLISRFLITWLFHLDLICPFEHIGCRVFTWWLHYMGLSI